MRTLLIVLLFCTTIFCQNIFDKKMFESKAGDVWHLTGSTIGTLTIQKYTGLEWGKAASIMLAAGFGWEICDEFLGKKLPLFDPAGGDSRDIIYDSIGILISYPLRYEKCKIVLGYNKINVSIAL